MQPKRAWRVSKNQAGMRLLQFLRDNCPEAPSVKALKRAIEGKLCTVNNRVETFSSYVLKEGDQISLSKDAFATGETKPLTAAVLYEDADLLIISKPAGVVCDSKSLKKCVAFKSSFELVHRLDKETSGVLVLAKTLKSKEKMLELFKERAVRKLYLALVDGIPAKQEGTIDNYLGKKHSYQGQAIYGSVDAKSGQRAITLWKCLKKGKNASILSCEPHTGRTHQLRVHLSGLGHPILGDTQYAKKFRCSFKPQRNLLHAYAIAFKHPISGQALKVIAPIPADFKQALETLQISLGKPDLTP